MSKQLSILYALKMSLSHLADHIMFGSSEMFRLEPEGEILLVTKLQWLNRCGTGLHLHISLKKYSGLQQGTNTIEINLLNTLNVPILPCLMGLQSDLFSSEMSHFDNR